MSKEKIGLTDEQIEHYMGIEQVQKNQQVIQKKSMLLSLENLL